MSGVSEESLKSVEADSFWCFSKLLDGIQDNYTFAQPGIQLKVRFYYPRWYTMAENEKKTQTK